MCQIMGGSVLASNAVSQLQNEKEKKQQTEDKIDSINDNISTLASERAGFQQYVNSLNSKLQTLSVEQAEIEGLIEEKETTIREKQKELKDAKEGQIKQYASMKSRIKFMYESGESTYMALLFSSSSFSEFLNKNQYFTKLTEYDREMLEQYVETQKRVKSEEADLEAAQVALESLRREASDKSADVAAIVKEAGVQMEKYADEIAEQEKQMLAYEKELEQANYNIQNLEKELASQRQITNSSVMRDLSNVHIAAGDIDLMAAIIECEAGGESYTGKVAVGAVVLNRVKSSAFPNTVLEVIYQNRQFSPVGSGRFAVVLARGANASCYQAANDAMSGISPVGDKLFFRTPIPGLTGQQIGGHIFY